jgi:gliding motility-associated peptidyl-prolyl isomerase
MRCKLIFSAFLGLLFSCTTQEPRRPVSQKTATIISETIEQNKKLIALENEFIENYIAQDTIHAYQIATNGFWYYYNLKDEIKSVFPKFGDVVEIAYNIQDVYGNEIYSKKALGVKSYAIDKESFIAGLQEGLKLMKVGETMTFLIPSYRAYGFIGDGHKIKSNQTIKSTVTLLNIKNSKNENN